MILILRSWPGRARQKFSKDRMGKDEKKKKKKKRGKKKKNKDNYGL